MIMLQYTRHLQHKTIAAQDHCNPSAGLRHFGKEQASVEEVVSYLDGAYCGHISVETGHLSTLHEREWLADRFEELRKQTFSAEEKRRLATIMLESQVSQQDF